MGSGPSNTSGGATGETVLVTFFQDGIQATGPRAAAAVRPWQLRRRGHHRRPGPAHVPHHRRCRQGGRASGRGRPPRRRLAPPVLAAAAPDRHARHLRRRGHGRRLTAPPRPSRSSTRRRCPSPSPATRWSRSTRRRSADAQGVTPICTRTPACPLHEVTLAAALAESRPVALLIGTPAYCQTGICGPVLDLLLAQHDAFPGIDFLHADIYVDPGHALSSGSTTAQGADLGDVTPVGEGLQPALRTGAVPRQARRHDRHTPRQHLRHHGAEAG